MVGNDVEKVLCEIRERVRAETVAGRAPSHGLTENVSSPASDEDALSRLETNIVVIARAWDKLPPLISYRQGFMRQFELWLKRQIKRATRWYTWEQVNFNASTNNALRETLIALRAHDKQLAEIKEAYEEQFSAMKEEQEEQLALLEAEIATLASIAFVEKEIAQLQFQMRELGERVLDEQRVCFKQLNLETSESFALSDRTRRHIQTRLDELARHVEELRRTAAVAATKHEQLASTSQASSGG